VADVPPPPVAIRITRPYDSEDEYLAQELEMVSKTSITLVGAQPRPQGVVLRFELVLTGGAVLVRGEGRVVGFKPNAHRGVGGLTLRFTRIDARSKALLDKATALREQRRPSSKPPKDEAAAEAAQASDAAGSPPPPPIVAAAPPPLPVAAVPPPLPAPLPSPPEPPADTPLPPVLAVAAASPAVEAAPASTSQSPPPVQAPGRVAAGPERDSLLERLRTRAKNLEPEVVRAILAQRRRGTA
jgi:molecular chaperone DnaK